MSNPDARISFSENREKIHPQDRTFAKDFSVMLLERDFIGIHGMFASWLQQIVSVEKFQDFVERECRELTKHFAEEVDALLYPEASYIYLGQRDSEKYELLIDPDDEGPIERKPAAEIKPEDFVYRNWFSEQDQRLTIPAEVSHENFINEVSLEFRPSQVSQDRLGFDAFFMLRLILVQEQEKIKVGYFEIDGID